MERKKEAKKKRSLIVQREGGDWSPLSECLLLFAARVMHVEKIIKPALKEGKIVISDRFTDSTRSYQGYGLGFDLKKIEELNTLVLDGFKPDLTFILDVAPEVGLTRSERRLISEQLYIRQTEDKFERLDFKIHKKIRKGFLIIADKEPERCKVIDSTLTIEEMANMILAITQKRL